MTGSHRSGSTWVGTTLGKSSSVGYIHEPFNLEHRLGICGAKFDYWFPYITEDNEEIVCEKIQKTLDFKYNIMCRQLRTLLDNCYRTHQDKFRYIQASTETYRKL